MHSTGVFHHYPTVALMYVRFTRAFSLIYYATPHATPNSLPFTANDLPPLEVHVVESEERNAFCNTPISHPWVRTPFFQVRFVLDPPIPFMYSFIPTPISPTPINFHSPFLLFCSLFRSFHFSACELGDICLTLRNPCHAYRHVYLRILQPSVTLTKPG